MIFIYFALRFECRHARYNLPGRLPGLEIIYTLEQ
jgi:hypothetical protein